MKPNSLKQWMLKNNKKPVDVAAMTGVSQKTVERFLKGETKPVPAIMAAIERLVHEEPEEHLKSGAV